MTNLKKHVEESNERFSELNHKIDVIKDNHLAHVASDLSELKSGVAVLKEAVENNKAQLKWIMALIGGSTVVGAGINLLLNK